LRSGNAAVLGSLLKLAVIATAAVSTALTSNGYRVPFRELLRRTLRCLDREAEPDIRNRVVWLQDFT